MAQREFYERLGSSQDRAIELARAGAPTGTRVVVREQTAGRGRNGHLWASPAGGLYLSVITGRPPQNPALVSLSVGARLAEALEQEFGLTIRIKWPNDLLVSGRGHPARKLAGILVDRVLGGSGAPVDVVGVGLNLSRPPGGWDAPVDARAIALEECVTDAVDVGQAEELAYRAIVDARHELDSVTGSARLLAACRRRLYGIGARARVDGRDAGRVSHLGEDGALWMTGDSDTFAVRAGELAIAEEAG